MPISPCKLTINLGAVRYNFNYLKSLSKSDVGAAVKANAYGLGAKEVCKILQEEGCNIFFVAHLQEAIELRKVFEIPDLYVLNGIFEGEEEEFVDYNIRPVLSTGHQAKIWQTYAKKTNRKLACAVHADSGMNRLGMNENELLLTSYMSELDVLYFISHLACADDKDNQHNHDQLDKFKSYLHFFPNANYSFANSSGIFLGNEFHFDLLRPGMALYGLNPTPDKPNPMKNPVTLSSRIIQIRELDNDGFVGYSATYKAAKGSRIATIPIGYADGFMRYLSNIGTVYINDEKAPIIGRVSMDLITIDVTNIPCDVGSPVEIIGKHINPEDISKMAATIGYEILTSLGKRHQRVYIDEKIESE